MVQFPTTLGALSFALISCACVGDPAAVKAPPHLVTDSAGVQVVRSNEPLWPGGVGWTVAPEPEVVIVSQFSPPTYNIFLVGSVIRLSDGRIVVENRGSEQLLVFDSDGQYLSAWGGPGQGPGEFRRMAGLYGCGGDSLMIRDRGGVTFMDSDGRTVRIGRTSREYVANSRAFPMGTSAGCGALLMLVYSRSAWTALRKGVIAPTTIIVWVPTSGEQADTLGEYPGPEVAGDEDQYSRFPFSHTPSWGNDGKLVYFGSGAVARIDVLDQQGRLVRIIRWGIVPAPITREDWAAEDSERARFIAWEEIEEGNLPGRDAHPGPYLKPVFTAVYQGRDYESALLFDDEGNLWVRQYRRPSLFETISTHRPLRPQESWWVFDPTYRWLGEVTTPGNLAIKSISGGYLLGVSRDELDTEEVRLYRLDKGLAG